MPSAAFTPRHLQLAILAALALAGCSGRAWEQSSVLMTTSIDTVSSGVWGNPVTITGQPETGDAWQYYTGSWSPILMGGTNQPQGLPFIIEGELLALQSETWGTIKALFE
ncbi:hypothetical protein JW921_10630 [Candidatus Fermentibacterales bacterium]|nr:hypothetical protein [Candidatus Fermentibacterales bacterium]